MNDHKSHSVSEIMDRREVVKTLGVLGMTSAIGALLPACRHLIPAAAPSQSVDFKNEEPIVIIGGGIAGLTCAFYLARSGIKSRIYEASDRLGGRMFTKENFNNEKMTCELGGELVDSNHKDLLDLCHFFGIEVDDFSSGDLGLEQNLYYFSRSPTQPRVYFTDVDAIRELQKFDKKFRIDLKLAETKNGVEKFDQMSLEKYLAEYHNQVEKWFLDLLAIAYTGEGGLEPQELSAMSLLWMLSPATEAGFEIFGDSDESKRIRGGNIILIRKMTNWLTEHGIEIESHSRFTAIKDKGTALELSFERALNGKGSLTVNAKRAVCTIPFTQLRKIDGLAHLDLNPVKKACIFELGYATCGKIMLGYSDKLWRKGLVMGSKSIPKSNGMVYTDLYVQNLWETSRCQPHPDHLGQSGIITAFIGGKAGAEISGSFISQALSNTNEIFPGTAKNHDGKVALFNWTKYPLALGSYGAMKIGQATQFGRSASLPELNGRLLFAGEHAAPKFSGFMNGACLSGRVAAETLILQSTSMKKTS